ncbi:hypothetical protein Desor_0192 [Desulfosporosinus orientis DSM 765]|uniref:4Fe-4S ferredoxin-type domain-containing protein n=1 Tax=Desulfosporosinus orientis (strain ATCC 19365 / DSM 765 / NCIMB 8382 / VKM B-1628 / Singapore I) TaxID=768706 RepID=G7W7J2_DESOD|nr:hypothetical protein [Desulfosporosinus orientis]AET65911.1 hypothetical protein Desor_0192 [Desulfosporosinus orientis DSM 765]
MLEFAEKSLTVRIDTSKCDACETKACAEACKKYARGLLGIDDKGRASVAHHDADEVLRLGTECLACELACKTKGNNAITIEVPVKGLDEYLQKRQ